MPAIRRRYETAACRGCTIAVACNATAAPAEVRRRQGIMLKNTETSYGSVTKFLHWLMAAWIATAYVVIIWLTWGHTEGLIPGLNYHKVVGFSILVPFVVRVVWRLFNPAPALPAGMPRWQVWLSR